MATPLPDAVRLQIVDRHRVGESLHAIALDLGIHYETARKWWRIGRDQGREQVLHRPRRKPGTLHQTPLEIVKVIRTLRQQHPGWGLPYLRQQLLQDPQRLSPELRAQVPSLSSFYRFVHATEEQPFNHRPKNEAPTTPLITQTRHPHHLWQVDLKERCPVRGLARRITVLNLRDVFSSVTIGSEVFELRRTNASLRQADVQLGCRRAFEHWGLPDRLRTDQGSCFTGTLSQTGFPSYFMLWLVGLGIEHEILAKGQVTQNGCVERYNRTYGQLVLRDGPFANLAELRTVSEATVEFLNTKYPCQAGRCQGRPPLVAYPKAASPRRPYTLEQEAQHWDLKRVDAYLARFRWQRRTDGVGKVSLGRTDYYLGRACARITFDVVFDPTDRHFVFTTPDGQVTLRRPARGLDTDHILNIEESEKLRLRHHEKVRRAENDRPLYAYGT